MRPRRRSFAALSVVVLLASLVVGLSASPAAAATIVVDTAIDEFNAGPNCSLREAITAANNDSPFGGCPAGSGADTIVLSGIRYTLTRDGAGDNGNISGDLDILTPLTITGQGSGQTIIDAGNRGGNDNGTGDRVFDIGGSGGNGCCQELRSGGLPSQGPLVVTMNSIGIRGGLEFVGGGIHNSGDLTLNDSVVGDPSADPSFGDFSISGAGESNVAESAGGGIFNQSALSLNDSEVVGNVVRFGQGGGISNGAQVLNRAGRTSAEAGIGGIALNMQGGTLRNNLASNGGGGLVNGFASLRGRQSDTSGGGGIAAFLSRVRVVGNTVDANQSTVDRVVARRSSHGDAIGGGILNGDLLNLSQSEVSDNSVSGFQFVAGGGIWSFGNAGIVNTTVSNNLAEPPDVVLSPRGSGDPQLSEGGGIWNSGSLSLLYSTVAENDATEGGGIYDQANTTTMMERSIIADNTTEDCDGSGAFDSFGFNLDSDATCGLDQGNDLQGQDPSLGPLAFNSDTTRTHALPATSPAVDHIPAGAGPAPRGAMRTLGESPCGIGVDQRGFPRPVDGDGDGQALCDIGAFELTAAPPTGPGNPSPPLNATLRCMPRSAINQIGTTHTVTCTVIDSDTDAPIVGETVSFSTSGVGDFVPGANLVPETDGSGKVTVDITSDEPGTQTISAVVGSDQDSVTKTWATEPVPQCSDGLDNDEDGNVDLDDDGCDSPEDDDESDEDTSGPIVNSGPCKGLQHDSEQLLPGGNFIVGTPGDDFLLGTPGDDVICGLAGNDVIQGAGGDDVMVGNAGDDSISGNGGHDLARGGHGDDILRGNQGGDELRGGADVDTVQGGKGHDDLFGGGGDDTLKGFAGNDDLTGGGGTDTCKGGSGSNTFASCEL